MILVFGAIPQGREVRGLGQTTARVNRVSRALSPDFSPADSFQGVAAAGKLKETGGGTASPSSEAALPAGAGAANGGGQYGGLRYESMVTYVPVRRLAQNIATTLERAAPQKRGEMLDRIPKGLRLFVFWELSAETKSRLVREWHDQAQRRFPERTPAILSSARKHLEMIPVTEEELRTGTFDFRTGKMFWDGLTPDEKIVSNLIAARFIGNSLPVTYPGQALIGPDGIRFLETFARAFSIPPSFIETARSALPPALSSDRIESDGFFFIPSDSSGLIRKSSLNCDCSGDHMCGGKYCDTAPNGCDPTTMCAHYPSPIPCTGVCKASPGAQPILSW